jgi:hypothetical protein
MVNYKINTDGSVFSIRRNKLLKPRLTNRGYLQVNLSGKQIYIHQLVAKTYISNPNNYTVINHKNGNKLDNNVDNLEWCTQLNNVLHYHGGKKLEKYGDRFRVRFWDKNKKKHLQLGIVNTVEEGLKMYNQYASQL